jgi:hypothetical protein
MFFDASQQRTDSVDQAVILSDNFNGRGKSPDFTFLQRVADEKGSTAGIS